MILKRYVHFLLKPLFPLFGIALFSFFLTACNPVQKLSQLETPDVTLKSLSLGSVSISNQEVLIALDVKNPNDQDLNVRKVTYNVSLENKALGEGVATDIRLPAKGDTVINTSLTAHLLSLLNPAFLQKETLSYQVTGTFYLESLSFIPIPFNKSGVINVNGLKAQQLGF